MEGEVHCMSVQITSQFKSGHEHSVLSIKMSGSGWGALLQKQGGGGA